jgi:hypothetical protein
MNGKNTPAPGDVVLLVGNVIAGEKEPKMQHVYGEPYSKCVYVGWLLVLMYWNGELVLACRYGELVLVY